MNTYEDTYEVKARIVLEEDNTITIDITAEFDKNDIGYCELKYHHVLTNQPCQFLGQVFQGWTSQNSETNKKFAEIQKRINNFDNLIDTLAYEPNEVPTYTLSIKL